MKYFKSLLALLFVGLSFSACNELEDYDNEANKVNYPAEAPALGYYTSEYTAKGEYNYGVIFTTNAAGDSILYLTSVGKPGTEEEGIVRTLGVAEDVEYNPAIGVLSATVPENNSHFEYEINVVMAYQKDAKSLVLNISYAEEKVATHISKSNEVPSFLGMFSGYPAVVDAEGKTSFSEEATMMFAFLKVENDTVGILVTTSTPQEFADFTINGATATIKGQNSGLTYNIQYDAATGVLSATDANGLAYYCGREVTEPEPETWDEYAVGKYVHGVTGGVYLNAFNHTFENMLGANLPSAKYETTLYRSSKKSNKYKISPWANNSEMVFSVDNQTGLITVQQSPVGFAGQAGNIFAIDSYGYCGEHPSTYDAENDVFTFFIALLDNQYIYGVDNDQFIMTGDVMATPKKEMNLPQLKLNK